MLKAEPNPVLSLNNVGLLVPAFIINIISQTAFQRMENAKRKHRQGSSFFMADTEEKGKYRVAGCRKNRRFIYLKKKKKQ